MAWLIALGDRLSSGAAARNDPLRAAASKALTADSEIVLQHALS